MCQRLNKGMKKIFTESLMCPRCRSTVVRRSQRRGIERLLSVIALYPFRCEDCRTRFKRIAFRVGKAWRPHTRRSFFRIRPIRAVSYVAHALLVLLTGQ